MAEPFNEADEDQLNAPAAKPPRPLNISTSSSTYYGGTIPEQDDDSSSASSMSSTGTVIPSPGRALFARPMGPSSGGGLGGGGRSLDPIPWTTYFEREVWVETATQKGDGVKERVRHHAYLTSPAGSKGPLFVTHHGAGSSGLSFAVLSAEIRKRLPMAGILSLDARGHGGTRVITEGGVGEGEGAVDLSLATFSRDLFNVIQETKREMNWGELPPIILVGHSLGGAVVTELAKSGLLGPTVLLGYAVLDVVEGSAMDALQSMQTYLSTRPTGFATLRDGIEWHVRSRTVRNAVSARTSVPALLVDSRVGEGKDEEGGKKGSEGDGTAVKGRGSGSSRPWRWRTDLAATQPFWEDWFVGLSKKFLEARGGKLLLLAGTDRLDTELTIGQMQGESFFFFFFTIPLCR